MAKVLRTPETPSTFAGKIGKFFFTILVLRMRERCVSCAVVRCVEQDLRLVGDKKISYKYLNNLDGEDYNGRHQSDGDISRHLQPLQVARHLST
jgi:hypothetical protein